MKLTYELSKLAISDLESIWHYTVEKWSIDQANKYYKLIFSAIDSICTDPQSGKSITEIKVHHRSKLVKSHMIIYKVEESIVLIDRILHQKMDIEYQLVE